MYIVDDICYAGEETPDIKVKEARALRGGMLLLTFSTGEQRLFDTTLLKGSAFEPLRDEKVLADFIIFHGVMTWMNGDIDIAPEFLFPRLMTVPDKLPDVQMRSPYPAFPS